MPPTPAPLLSAETNRHLGHRRRYMAGRHRALGQGDNVEGGDYQMGDRTVGRAARSVQRPGRLTAHCKATHKHSPRQRDTVRIPQMAYIQDRLPGAQHIRGV